MVVEVSPIVTYRSTEIFESITVKMNNYMEVIQWMRDRKIPFKIEDNGDTMKIDVGLEGLRLMLNSVIVYGNRSGLRILPMVVFIQQYEEVVKSDRTST